MSTQSRLKGESPLAGKARSAQGGQMTLAFPRHPWRLGVLVGAAASCCALGVQAQTSEPSPYGIGVSETLTHESNLDRDVSGAEKSDLVSVTALNFSLDQPIGRQRLHANAALQLNRYRDHDERNGGGHDVSLQLDWETIENLSGLLGVQSVDRQYRYGLDSAQPFDGKNDERTQSAFARAKWGGMGVWSLMAGANVLDRSYSVAEFDATNKFRQWSAEAGGGYRPSPDLGFALVARHTRITRPDTATLTGDDVGRNDLEATATWQASGASRLEGRLTHSSENHSVTADEDFWTGGLTWDWAPSAKLRFLTRVLRDTEGSSGNIASPEATMPASPAGAQLRDALEWSVQWSLSPKVNVLAGAQWSRRHLQGLGGETGTELIGATDRTTGLSLGIRYAPLRSLDLGCDLRSEKRDTNTTDLTLTRPYDSLSVGCVLALWFR